VETYGVEAKDEHLILTPNRWTNQENELGYLKILTNYVAANQQNWVDHLELANFCYKNSRHLATKATPFQMVMRKSPIMLMIWATHGQPPNGASEEVSMVTQLDEERGCLWEMAKANLEKAHK
jgi:hypothetical protein